MKDSENQKDVTIDEDVNRNHLRQPQKTEGKTKTTNNNSTEAIENKRRRLSKKERKALKNYNKQKKLKLNIGNGNGNGNGNGDNQSVSKTVMASQDERGNCHDENVKKEITESDSNGVDNVDVDVESEEERIRLECMESYIAIDIPKEPSTDLVSRGQKNKGNNDNTAVVDDEGGCRTLGKWFPSAILIKSSVSYTNTGKLIMAKDNKQQQNQ